MKNICVLGITGSIGTQTVDVVVNNPEDFKIVSLSAGHNITLLRKIINQIKPEIVAVIEKEDAAILSKEYQNIKFVYGEKGLIEVASYDSNNVVLNAIVGFAGMKPTIAAIKKGKDIALANKETLVVCGQIITDLVKEYNVKLLPVDSEHSAIFQSLQGNKNNKIRRIILTASGGSFRNKTLDELKGVTVKEALNHPNWSMGAKITIDSATMVNKGLEIMEAKWLFDVDYDQIEVVIHPESILHSAVEYEDGAVIGQMGTPDMRLPIQYALTYPNRQTIINSDRLDLTKISQLNFIKPDLKRFEALDLAIKAGKIGGSMPCVFNGANEQANSLFLSGDIEFLDIVSLIKKTMSAHKLIKEPSLENLIEVDLWAKEYVKEIVGGCDANNN
ncbi:MAG: 1-deoxy-D-xylulose-5-phosphate reductoisomerase [Thomasclavelia sp.]|jgi:1-deoxy-D-xylulose-5-phosphate reductoisomerase|nr:1-deoxy-D-xylulose-5-phosphate reductoisomerase [Thomasclavelia sp.]